MARSDEEVREVYSDSLLVRVCSLFLKLKKMSKIAHNIYILIIAITQLSTDEQEKADD